MNSDHEYDSIMRRGDATEPQIPDGLTFREILFNYLDVIAGFGAYAANTHDRNFYCQHKHKKNSKPKHKRNSKRKHKRNSKRKHKRNSKRNKFAFKRR